MSEETVFLLSVVIVLLFLLLISQFLILVSSLFSSPLFYICLASSIIFYFVQKAFTVIRNLELEQQRNRHRPDFSSYSGESSSFSSSSSSSSPSLLSSAVHFPSRFLNTPLLIQPDSSATPVVGFEPYLFLNESDADKNICAICTYVLRQPVEVSCSSGHLYCYHCWMTFSKVDSKNPQAPIAKVNCPQCCENISPLAAHLSRSKRTEIWNLPIKCPRSTEGCDLILKNGMGRGERHLAEHANICMFETVGCSRCEQKMLRRDLARHKENECYAGGWTGWFSRVGGFFASSKKSDQKLKKQ